MCQYRVLVEARAWKLRQTWVPELDKLVLSCVILEIIIGSWACEDLCVCSLACFED